MDGGGSVIGLSATAANVLVCDYLAIVSFSAHTLIDRCDDIEARLNEVGPKSLLISIELQRKKQLGSEKAVSSRIGSDFGVLGATSCTRGIKAGDKVHRMHSQGAQLGPPVGVIGV